MPAVCSFPRSRSAPCLTQRTPGAQGGAPCACFDAAVILADCVPAFFEAPAREPGLGLAFGSGPRARERAGLRPPASDWLLPHRRSGRRRGLVLPDCACSGGSGRTPGRVTKRAQDASGGLPRSDEPCGVPLPSLPVAHWHLRQPRPARKSAPAHDLDAVVGRRDAAPSHLRQPVELH